MSVKRGDIFYADLSPVVGSEQGGLRPVLIIQNDVGNRYSPTVIAAAITSRMGKTRLPTHIDIYADKPVSPRIPSFFSSRYVPSINAALRKKWDTWTTVSWIRSTWLSQSASASARQKAPHPHKPPPPLTSPPPFENAGGMRGCEDAGTRGMRGRDVAF